MFPPEKFVSEVVAVSGATGGGGVPREKMRRALEHAEGPSDHMQLSIQVVKSSLKSLIGH